jgi:hypothetical protein
MHRIPPALAAFVLVVSLASLRAEQQPRFRTDADGPVTSEPKKARAKGKQTDQPPEWFQLVEGQFPPEGSAHAVAGELIRVDHLERRFAIRVDRNDSQERGVWDLPLEAGMLPYGEIWYQGAPAALPDIPLGTHLHGLFYLADPDDKTPLPDTFYKRRTPEWEFRRCFRLEDDFTHHQRQGQLWNIEHVDRETKKLHAVLWENGQSRGAIKQFDLLDSTRVFQGKGFGDLQTLQAGQRVLFNLTWATLYGPGRITDLWLDDASRGLSTARQWEVHRHHIRERGLAGWVTAVEDEPQLVTITFFAGVDPKLFDELAVKAPHARPAAEGSPPPPEVFGRLAVARDSLMTYDPVNDSKRGSVLEMKRGPVVPGSSGVQLTLKMEMMLEGYRPNRVVRFYPPTWKVIALPKEESFHGRE